MGPLDQPWKITRMNKITFALALGTGLALTAAAPSARADAIQTIATPTLSAATFNADFAPVNSAEVSPFQFSGATGSSGTIQSQVFQGIAGTPEAGKFAYAYQVQVNSSDGSGMPNHVDSASLQFNATPEASSLAGSANSYGYVITDGKVGGLGLSGAVSPTSLSWQPFKDAGVGYIRAQFVDPASQNGTLPAGNSSATFVVLTSTPPLPVTAKPTTVNIGGGSATTTVPVAYSASLGAVLPIPSPEPATLLSWGGMIGAVAIGLRFRKARLAAA
jgi:hypothetical protein